MKPIVMRLDLSQPDQFQVKHYESSQTAEQLRISGSRDLDPNNIDGNLIKTLDYSVGNDLYEDAAAYHATREALLEVGIQVGFFRHSSPETNGIAVMGLYSSPIRKPHDMAQADFFDLLRELDDAIVNLADYLRAEEASVRDVRLKMARAAADAMHGYLNIDFEGATNEIPRGPIIELRNRLGSVDWQNYSEKAYKWVTSIQKWLKFFDDMTPPSGMV